ncbi:MAG: hypothetical protein IKW59_07480 [Clostridia bacterium]|nr:hypothetical protein [Clostridia bacterium]
MSVGKRIYLKRNMPDSEILEKFQNIPAANVADCMERICAMNPRIRLISKPKNENVVAPAYTVKVRGGDNLALHAALTYCSEACPKAEGVTDIKIPGEIENEKESIAKKDGIELSEAVALELDKLARHYEIDF